jgi:hypothetical protein
VNAAQARGQIGGRMTMITQGARQVAARARAGQRARWEREVDAAAAARGERLTPPERAARVAALQWVHCARMRAARGKAAAR